MRSMAWNISCTTTEVHVRERQVGFVFQHYALFRHMTVFENVAFGLRVKPRGLRPSDAQTKQKVDDLLGLVQLDWLADRVVLMNAGRVEQIGSPQEVWDHPASPFVYGFLGDVNLFHGRAHEGEVQIGADHHGVRLDSPEHHAARDARAFAYVRPHDLEVRRYTPGATGIAAKLARAIVVGPIARLELTRVEATEPGDNNIIEAQLPAQEFRELGLQEGETVLLTPRKARVFVDG